MRPIILLFCLISLLLTAASAAQERPATPGPRWTADDVVYADLARDFRISPDGKWVVWVKSVAHKEKNRRITHLMLSSLEDKKEYQLTRGTENASQPRWSPDGEMISFLSSRKPPEPKPAAPGKEEDEPKGQLWVLRLRGGDPWPLTELKREVRAQEWADNGTILIAAQEMHSLYEERLNEEKHDSIVVDDEEHEPPVRLFEVKVKDGKMARLTDNADRIQNFAVSPDGRWAVSSHERSLSFVFDNKVRPVVFLWDLKEGQGRQLFADFPYLLEDVRWAPDSKGFYAAIAYSRHPLYIGYGNITQLHYYDVASGERTQVDLGWENGLAHDFEVTPDGFVALLAAGARHKAARYTREGAGFRREWLAGEHAANLFGVELSKDGKTLVYNHSTASKPVQWYRARLNGAQIESPTQFTDLNPQLRKKTIARSEVVRWKGANDDEVEGILYYPHHYQQGKKYALVVMPHGGPAGADFDEWDESYAYPVQLIAQRGAFVLKPNYHGSSNYGLEWVESIGGGKYYDLEVPDLEKGVDSLIERGLVDPEQLGALGWSNGSILTIALTINSTRYKAAGAGAGDVEWASDWANAHFGAAFDNYYFGKSPLEDPQLYLEKSPFYKLDRVRTPTIIFFGTEDTNVPSHQGWMHYRALQQLGKTDVRYLVFPGEKHGFRKLSNQKRKLTEEMAWFDRHLFKTYQAENEALRPGSPLAVALKRTALPREGARFGRMHQGKLIPEVAPHEGLELGRFEVTRAQYAEFDKTYKVEPGKENFPANNIAFEQAKAYADWLSKQTGAAWRLPTEEEAESLYGGAGDAENTLDHWAGYAVNPEDARRLAALAKELGEGAALLKEVGSFKGKGDDDPVFDLGGNVAEWAVGKDGKGKLVGGSADTPVDARLRSRQPAAAYTGFRVVKGAAPAATATAGK